MFWFDNSVSVERLELVGGSQFCFCLLIKRCSSCSPSSSCSFAGILLTVGFVLASVLADSFVSEVMDVGKFIMAFFVILCPGLALSTTFGLFGWLGWRVNSVSLITPFLIMGIGVNDAFLILHAWHRTPVRCISIPQRIGLIMEDVGPSITITTVTDVTTFVLGSFTPTEEISIFCYVTAVALFFCYLFTLLVLTPAMAYCTRLELEHGPPSAEDHRAVQVSSTTCILIFGSLFTILENWQNFCIYFIYSGHKRHSLFWSADRCRPT